MRKAQKIAAAAVAAATLVTGAVFSGTAAAATPPDTVIVTPNPWFANGPFRGWGTSLAWFANATGNYGEPGSIKINLGDAASEKKALAYGKDLRQSLYDAVFTTDGLGLNMARYNVGGGNADDVAYGYPFFRQGAAVPGTWKSDANGVRTVQSNKDQVDRAFKATDPSNYDFGKSKAQDWWASKAASTGDVRHFEVFSNSAPWFMTVSGYASGNTDSGKSNLADVQKFGQYMAMNAKHVANLPGSPKVDSVEPFNESETNYWGTPGDMATKWYDPSASADAGSEANAQLIKRYYERWYKDAGKNLAITPYSSAVKKPQEGSHIDIAQQPALIKSLYDQLQVEKSSDSKLAKTVVSGTDATNQADFTTKSYPSWDAATKAMVGQYNTHAYGEDAPRQARDIAQSDDKPYSMSEVDGAWQGGSFNPFGFSNATGIAGKITQDVNVMQAQDWTFWQAVEDLYNMQTPNDGTHNPGGEDTNWGTVLIDFDCDVAGPDGKLYSERRYDNNGKSIKGLHPCSVLVNQKFNGMRAITHFIRGDSQILSNNDPKATIVARDAADSVQTVIHTNASSHDQKFVIDLSKYGTIAPTASGDLYLTTKSSEADEKGSVWNATPQELRKTSDVRQPAGSVVVDAAAKTATVTVPADSIASIQLHGVSGVAKEADPVKAGEPYQLIGKGSGIALSATQADDSALSLQSIASDQAAAAPQLWKLTPVAASAVRPTVRRYVIQNSDGKVLYAKSSSGGSYTNALKEEPLDRAKTDPSALWLMNTEDGTYWEFANALARQSLDCNGQGRTPGTKVGLWTSGGGDHQNWELRNIEVRGVRPVAVHTIRGVMPKMPTTVTPYYDSGDGAPTAVTWDTSRLADQIKKDGSYTVSGTIRDYVGKKHPATATVSVGGFNRTDPASVTVREGSTVDDVKAAAPKTVKANLDDSSDFSTPVTWDWSTLHDSDLAHAGSRVTVKGSASDGDFKTIPATLTVYATGAGVGDNIAPQASADATYTEPGHPASDTNDQNLSTVWSDWKDGGGDPTPALTYAFSEPKQLSKITVYPEQSRGEATPVSFHVQYQKEDGSFADFGSNPAFKGSGTIDPATESLIGMPATKKVRVIFDISGNYYTKISEVQLFGVGTAPASDPELADLRSAGNTVSAFDPATHAYTVTVTNDSTTDYPQAPLIQAYARDNAAKVTIDQPSEANDYRGTIHVVSADGSKTADYSVDVVRGKLASIKVTPSVTKYSVGDRLDRSGLRIMAEYRDASSNVVARKAVDPSDPKLQIAGFDTSTATAASQPRMVLVSWNGASDSYQIEVAGGAHPTAPTEPTAPTNPSKPGAASTSHQAAAPRGGHGATALSSTGSAVIGIVVVALLALAGGLALVRIRRAHQQER